MNAAHGICKEILNSAEGMRGYLAQTLSRLISIKSPSRGEREIIDFIAREMRAIGFDSVRVDRMGNLIGLIGDGERAIAFDAHADVVEASDAAEWTYPPFEGRLVNGEIYGRGACDQKGAIAAMLAAARLLRKHPTEGGRSVYMIVSVQEEECEGLSWLHIIEEEGLRPDSVVLTEPSALRIARGQKGKLEMIVETRGIASHGSAPERGDNAIYRMAPIVLAIQKLNEALPASPPFQKGTATVSRIESSAPSVCSVPEGCRIYIDRRLGGGESREKALAEIEAIASLHGGKVFISRYEGASYTGLKRGREHYYPMWLLDKNDPLVTAAVEAYRTMFGREGEVIVWNFSTNGIATCGFHKIPTIGFGPGDPAFAHTRDERVPLEHVVASAAFYAALPRFY